MLAFFLLLIGCTSQSTTHQSIDWTLSQGWDRQPWDDDYVAQKGQSLNIITNISIPERYPTKGASLELSGLWWTAELTINGAPLESVTGGIVPVEVEVGQFLKSGKNHIEIRIAPPKGISRLVTGGSLSSVNPQSSSSLLPAPPILKLRPLNHIQNSTVVLTQNGISPWAALSSTLEGHSVHFELYDGTELVMDLGKAESESGVAQGPSSPWTLPSWDLGSPVFYTLKSTLESPGGQVLHEDFVRVAPRNVEQVDSGISINGTPTALMGARMVYRIGGEDWATRMKKYHDGGVNALELHGEWLKSDWLTRADEMGIPLIIVPRCIGRCNMRQPGQTEGREEQHKNQDNRMVSTLLNHPSKVLYALEGPVKNIPLWTNRLLDDPHGTPVAGHHFPARILRLVREGNLFEPQCQPKDCTGAWLTETTMRLNATEVPWSEVATEYATAIKNGSVGGVIPTPSTKDVQYWQNVWKPVSDTLDIRQLTKGPFRAPVDIEITGLSPYALLEVNVPNKRSLVFTANVEGNVTARIWANGKLGLRSGEETKEISVTDAHWDHFEYTGSPNHLQWK